MLSALKGQKPYEHYCAFALSGRSLRIAYTQGVALGYVFIALSGRFSEIAELELENIVSKKHAGMSYGQKSYKSSQI